MIWDLGAQSGVKVNGHPVTQDTLKVGDVMTLGDLDLHVRFPITPPAHQAQDRTPPRSQRSHPRHRLSQGDPGHGHDAHAEDRIDKCNRESWSLRAPLPTTRLCVNSSKEARHPIPGKIDSLFGKKKK